MPSIGKKEPEENMADKVRSFFSLQNGQKNKNALPPKTHFSIWYFFIAVLLFTYLQQYLFSPKVETIPYSQFKENLSDGTVGKLTIGPENITGTLKGKDKKPEQRFVTIRIDDPGLVKELDELARLLSQKEMVQGEELRQMLSESTAEIGATSSMQSVFHSEYNI